MRKSTTYREVYNLTTQNKQSLRFRIRMKSEKND